MEAIKAIANKKISITTLSKELNYSRAHISRVVSGKQKPSKKLKKLLENYTDKGSDLEKAIVTLLFLTHEDVVNLSYEEKKWLKHCYRRLEELGFSEFEDENE